MGSGACWARQEKAKSRLEAEADIVKFYGVLDTTVAAIADREKLQHMTYEPSEFVELTVFTMSTVNLQKAVIKYRKEIFSPQPATLRRQSNNSK